MGSFSLPLVLVAGCALKGRQCVDPVVGEEADPTESSTQLMRLSPDYSVTALDLGWKAIKK